MPQKYTLFSFAKKRYNKKNHRPAFAGKTMRNGLSLQEKRHISARETAYLSTNRFFIIFAFQFFCND